MGMVALQHRPQALTKYEHVLTAAGANFHAVKTCLVLPSVNIYLFRNLRTLTI